MRGKKGFTLVELLVAAAISSILLVFAAIQYRDSAAEARWTQAKSRAEQAANAVAQMKMDYNISFNPAISLGTQTPDECPSGGGAISGAYPYLMIKCGYLEWSTWVDVGYYEYHVCADTDVDINNKCPHPGASVCVVPNCKSRLPEKYEKYTYCVSAAGAVEGDNYSACE